MNNHEPSIAPSGYKELDEELQGGFIRPSNLMIIGPPLCGKKLFSLEILSHGLETDEAAIYISTSHTAEEVRAQWLKSGLKPQWEEDGKVKYVDCYSKMLGIQSSDTPSIRRIPSVLDFTKLSVTLYELGSDFLKKEVPIRLVLDSLSSMLVYSSSQVVMRFLHILMGKLRMQKVLGLFLLEEGTQDETTINQLKTYSDGVIQMNRNQKTMDFIGFTRSRKTPLSYEVTEKGVLLQKTIKTPKGNKG